MKLKRFLPLWFLLAAVAAGALFAVPALVRQAVVRSVKNLVPGSEASVGSCRFERGNNLTLQDIRISLKSPSKNFPRLRLPDSGKSPLSFFLGSITVKGLQLDIQTSDLSLSGMLSFTRDLRKGAFEDLTLDIPSLRLGTAEARNIRASSDKAGEGLFSADSLVFSKFRAEKIHGRFRLSDAGALLDDVGAEFLSGTVKGRLTVTRLGEQPVATAELDLANIPIASFLKLWDWDKKCAADGSLRGHLLAEVSGGKLTKFDGAMIADAGGNLVILDQAFLENIAARSKQPIEIVKASFEDYHYNTGTVGVSLEQNSLRLDLDLEGEKGKRNLEVTLHDWF